MGEMVAAAAEGADDDDDDDDDDVPKRTEYQTRRTTSDNADHPTASQSSSQWPPDPVGESVSRPPVVDLSSPVAVRPSHASRSTPVQPPADSRPAATRSARR